MADYDFHQLSPRDLERLTRDLLQAELGLRLESFKAGRDDGIDLRYAAAKKNIVVQCKHYVRTGLVGLLRDLGKEAEKVRKLRPSRYILVTSVPLSPANKASIVDIIGPHLVNSGDVFGQDDLNNLLGRNPTIEGRHYKLWLASRAVLDRVLNNAVLTQSEFKVRTVYQDIRRYVHSNAYPRARAMLQQDRIVMLAGPPGVGKTTLANILLYEHLEKGYQAVVIQRDIEEGQKLLQEGKNQIFYFDDFIGATFLGDRASTFIHNEDKALLDFIAMVRSSPTARLVLTTREHIFTQAIAKSERLRHSEISDFRLPLRMPDYSLGQKAQILYNHLYFSGLPPEYQDELLRDDFYFRIIKHEKFNPRLIEWLSTYKRLKNVKVGDYQTFVNDLLRDPSEIWRHAYEQEISDAGRSLLLALFSESGKAGWIILKPAFTALHSARAEKYGFTRRPEDFWSAVRELAGAFVKPSSAHAIEVVDPSVLDLLNAVVRDIPENAVDIVRGASRFDQIDHVWSFAKAERGRAIVSALSEEAFEVAAAMAPRLHDDRRVDFGQGAVGYRGATFERRLSVLIEMAHRLSAKSLSDLISPLSERMFSEWRQESVNISEGVELLRTIDRAPASIIPDVGALRERVRGGLLDMAQRGCSSSELRALISMIGLSDIAERGALQLGFQEFKQDYFSEDLSECRSLEQFDGLLDDLAFFQSQLDVDVERLLARVQESRAAFEEHQSDYEDHMEDEWKDRWREERATERSVSEMFGSLREDRN